MTEKDPIIEALSRFSTPELSDGAGSTGKGIMDYHICRQVTGKNAVGRAFTVKVPFEVSGIIPDAILAAQPGDILVIAGQNGCDRSYWGDHRSVCAAMKGIAGIIIDGAYRDKEGCEDAGVPVFARNVVCLSAGKAAEGELNVPVECGGVLVEPGDYIAADVNGIIVMKPSEVEDIIRGAEAKIEAESKTLAYMKETGTIQPRILKHLK
jgi:4-hydroxy-4-methyl-2-oxoglutarate aldolase